jgi:hypothetical protein
MEEYTYAESTQKLYDLALKAGEETRAEAIAAKETPVSRLTYTSRCGEITAEYYSAHHKVSEKAWYSGVPLLTSKVDSLYC